MDKTAFTELLKSRVLIGDGAMGTMLYEQGVFINTCFDELNITNPALVQKIHDDYIQAGCDFIETNTFGANEFKLGKFGLANKVEAINIAAVETAGKSVTGSEVLIAGSVGPLGCGPGFQKKATKKIHQAFSNQISALAAGGVDFLILETFSNPKELLIAIETATDSCNLPIVTQMTCNEQNETIYGNKIEHAITKIAACDGVSAVGLNCSIGPSAMLDILKVIRQLTDKPVSIQPNAGMPRDVDGRTMYMCTPEYMAEYAKRFFENGARIIGGCCGTTPQHIKEIARAVRSLDKAMVKKIPGKEFMPAAARTSVGIELSKLPGLGEKSKIGSKIARGEKIASIELTPPKGVDMSTIIERAKLCAACGIDAINIPDGPRASSRLSPLVTAVKIQENVDIETILHVCCRDKNIIGMQSDMLGAHTMGIKNVLLITGDPPKLGEYPDATGVFDLDSIALTSMVRNLNRGIDIVGNEFTPPLSLTISVGANPVASELAREIERFKQKAEAGAEFAITQPVFDAEMLFEFMDAVSEYEIPFVAGIWPFTSYKNAEFMANEVPGVVVPQDLLERMSKADTREKGRRIGVEIAKEMVEKIQDRVAGFAVSAPFGNVKIALAVLDKVGIDEI